MTFEAPETSFTRKRRPPAAWASPVTVPIVYHGSVPDLFKVGRHIVLTGRLRGSTFVGDNGSLVTKCPSKYAPAKGSSST